MTNRGWEIKAYASLWQREKPSVTYGHQWEIIKNIYLTWDCVVLLLDSKSIHHSLYLFSWACSGNTSIERANIITIILSTCINFCEYYLHVHMEKMKRELKQFHHSVSKKRVINDGKMLESNLCLQNIDRSANIRAQNATQALLLWSCCEWTFIYWKHAMCVHSHVRP